MEFRLRKINPLLNASITNCAKENEMSKNEFILKVLEDYFIEERVELKNELVLDELRRLIFSINRNTEVMSELIGITYELLIGEEEDLVCEVREMALLKKIDEVMNDIEDCENK